MIGIRIRHSHEVKGKGIDQKVKKETFCKEGSEKEHYGDWVECQGVQHCLRTVKVWGSRQAGEISW